MEVPSQEVITKDNSPTNVDAIVYIRVIDPEKAYFEVANYRIATIALAQTSLRGIIGDMELDEVLYNRDVINTKPGTSSTARRTSGVSRSNGWR